MKSLLCLDVSENKMEQLPEELGSLVSLNDLLVSQNLIDALPESIGKHVTPLHSVSTIMLTSNRLFLPLSNSHIWENVAFPQSVSNQYALVSAFNLTTP